MPLTNCEIELDLSWLRYSVISEVSRTSGAVPNTNSLRYQVTSKTISATFKMNNAKLYTPANTLSVENIKQGFKRTISWNKYRSEITTQQKKVI